MVFCTLFDSNYLDKGLALYCSMKKHIPVFQLYIFAFDSRCFEVLSDLSLKNTIVISVEDIMNEQLERIKKERTRGEFCWTCTSTVIEHVLLKYNEKICTYIDADIFFFADPMSIIQEILDNQCSVGLVEHKFERDDKYGKEIFRNGRYCIQFNTFLNNEEGRKVLSDWKKDCLQWCYGRREDGRFGDQKYPDKWKQKYSCVHVSQNSGAGIAPWNLHVYTNVRKENEKIRLQFRKKTFQVIFYHYEGMQYLGMHRIYLNLWKYSKTGTGKKVRLLYGTYFALIEQIREMLRKSYSITFDSQIADKSQYTGKNYSLGQFCRREGLLNGLKEWVGYWKNDIFIVRR